MMTKNQFSLRLRCMMFATVALGAGMGVVQAEMRQGDLFPDEHPTNQTPFGTFYEEDVKGHNEGGMGFQELDTPTQDTLSKWEKDSMSAFSILQSQTGNLAVVSNFSKAELNKQKADKFLVGVADMLNQPARESSMFEKIYTFVRNSIKNAGEKLFMLVADGDAWNPFTQEANEKVERYQDDKRIQKEVIEDLRDRIANNPVDRAAVDELIRVNAIQEKVNAPAMIQAQLDNPLVTVNFYETGYFSRAAELAMGSEFKKLGYFEQTPQGVLDSKYRSSVRKLWWMTTSPAEERIRYSLYAFYP